MLAAVLGLAGVALRASELGTWGLSNDEAWVALATRVTGWEQFRLAIAMTPIGWAGLVKLAALVFGGSEAALRDSTQRARRFIALMTGLAIHQLRPGGARWIAGNS